MTKFANIRNIQHFVENVSDFSMWNLYLPTKWHFGDLDGGNGTQGYIEHKGHLLVMEDKMFGKSIPTGQEITFSTMAKIGVMTTIVVWYEKEYQYTFDNKPMLDEYGVHEFNKRYVEYKVYHADGNIYKGRLSGQQYEDGKDVVDAVGKLMQEWIQYAKQNSNLGKTLRGN